MVVASEAHRRSHGGLDFDDLMLERGAFRPRLAYSRSKLANILFTRASWRVAWREPAWTSTRCTRAASTRP